MNCMHGRYTSEREKKDLNTVRDGEPSNQMLSTRLIWTKMWNISRIHFFFLLWVSLFFILSLDFSQHFWFQREKKTARWRKTKKRREREREKRHALDNNIRNRGLFIYINSAFFQDKNKRWDNQNETNKRNKTALHSRVRNAKTSTLSCMMNKHNTSTKLRWK